MLENQKQGREVMLYNENQSSVMMSCLITRNNLG